MGSNIIQENPSVDKAQKAVCLLLKGYQAKDSQAEKVLIAPLSANVDNQYILLPSELNHQASAFSLFECYAKFLFIKNKMPETHT
jgi:hypothetical protein